MYLIGLWTPWALEKKLISSMAVVFCNIEVNFMATKLTIIKLKKAEQEVKNYVSVVGKAWDEGWYINLVCFMACECVRIDITSSQW